MNDYKIRYAELPTETHGVIAKRKGKTTLIINSLLSPEEQQQTILHELSHYTHNDFDNSAPLSQIEERATAESETKQSD